MKNYTITRYSFEELTPEARIKAIENERNSAYNYIPEEFLSESMRQQLNYLIFGEDIYPGKLDISYSLGYCQGDGASFTGRINRSEALGLPWPANADYAEIVRGDRRYSHAYTIRAELFDDTGEELETPKEFADEIRKICGKLEELGYAEIEEWSSEARAIETLSEFGDIFLVNGTISQPVGLAPMISLA